MRSEAEIRQKIGEVYCDDRLSYDGCVAWMDALVWVLGEESPVVHESHYMTEKRPPLSRSIDPRGNDS